VQQKIEEDQQKEEEERLLREEEDRLRRELEMREEEERLKLEDTKRQAKKSKKKNKKKRVAEAAAAADSNVMDESNEKLEACVQSCNSGSVTVTLKRPVMGSNIPMGLHSAASNGPATRIASDVVTPVTCEKGMVTIRRCPSKDNLVTITPAGEKDDVLYYLLDGQCK
jgi:hypothetical protein